MPAAPSSRTHIGIDGLTIPAIGPTAWRSWQGDSSMRPGGGERLGGVGGVGPALVQAGADDRAPQGTGGVLPGDGRPGVQQLAAPDADQLGGGPDVHEPGPDRGHALDRGAVGAASRGSAATAATAGATPAGGGDQSTATVRTPWPASASSRFGAPTVTTAAGAASRSARSLTVATHAGPGQEVGGPGGGAGGAAVDRRAGVGQGGGLAVEPLGVAGRAHQGDDHAGTRGGGGGDRRGHDGGGIGVGAVAEDHVQQDRAGAARRRGGGQPVGDRGRVDHGVGATGGQLVVAQVEQDVGAVRHEVGTDPPVRVVVDVGAHRAQVHLHDGQRLDAVGAAAEQAEQRAADRRPAAGARATRPARRRTRRAPGRSRRRRR